MRSSPPIIAISDTDFGADMVTSRPGRWWISPSLPRLPRCGPSGTLPSRIALEHAGIDRARQAERLRALARPGARLAVRGVVFRVVAVALEIARALRRRGDRADRGYHRRRPPAVQGFGGCRMPMPANYALSGLATRHERFGSQPCRQRSVIVLAKTPSTPCRLSPCTSPRPNAIRGRCACREARNVRRVRTACLELRHPYRRG